MKVYVCTKRVKAEEMDYHTAGKKGLIRDYKPDSENVNGFHVVYEDGYESWSPYDAFIKGYELLEE